MTGNHRHLVDDDDEDEEKEDDLYIYSADMNPYERADYQTTCCASKASE